MSGGHWEYLQYRFTDVAEDIRKLIDKNGKEKTTEELKYSCMDDSWFEKYPDEKFHYKYSDEMIEKFKDGLRHIEIAQIYMQRLDWLLSGDDGDESFMSRLDNDLKKLEDEKLRG
jgi:hypothetical protein